ncbi:MAG: amidohydrolase family protein [bacterium]|nr:amidohydrolase family protein [bacterium]
MNRTAVLILWVLCLTAGSAASDDYPLVIRHGRVMDPETGLDAVRYVGIRGDRIARVSEQPLRGDREIDASGLVVAPGFIDLHTHSPTPLGQYYQLMDGVTTALELEAGAFPVGKYGSQISDEPLTHYGASVGYGSMRILQKDGIVLPEFFTGSPRPVGFKGWWTLARFIYRGMAPALARTFTEPATPEQREVLRAMLHEGLDQGGLGIGLPLDYFSEAIDEHELAMIFEVAAERRAPVFVHVRRGINGDPAGLREVLALAERTGAALHVCHISHNAMKNIELFLAEIRAARKRGVDVTTEVLPYNAGSTAISAAVFGRDWQTIFDISYEDVEWAATGERFDRAMWEEYRREHPDGAVIHHYLKEEWTRRAITEPGVIIVSDLIAMKSREEHVPPHNGAFTKILGRYVREDPALSLMTAVSKMTLLPARRLEHHAPLFRRKGRLQEGADADITIFDPKTVNDRATYRNPYQEAVGIEHVLVGGVQVVEGGELVEGPRPGQRLLAPRGQ